MELNASSVTFIGKYCYWFSKMILQCFLSLNCGVNFCQNLNSVPNWHGTIRKISFSSMHRMQMNQLKSSTKDVRFILDILSPPPVCILLHHHVYWNNYFRIPIKLLCMKKYKDVIFILAPTFHNCLHSAQPLPYKRGILYEWTIWTAEMSLDKLTPQTLNPIWQSSS